MTGLNRRAGKMGLGLAVAFAVLVSCEEDPTGSGGGGASGNISDPAAFEAYIQQKFLPGFLGVVDGIQRLIVAADGGTQDGVTITPTGANSFAATVAMDLNADGTRETTLSGGASGDIITGANLFVNGITTTDPSTTVAFSSTVTETGSGTSILMDDIAATLYADPPGSGNAATVQLTDGSVGLVLMTGTPSGFVQAEISGEGEVLPISMTFEPDGSGGWRVRFSGDGVDFTVP